MGNMTMPDSTKLTEVIAQCHKALDDVFLLHQEAVLLGRCDAAVQILNCFKELHHLHMEFEDKKLIPKLDGLGDRGHWPASLYTDEHAKIQELMGKTENDLLSLSKSRLSNKDFRRRIISFLDKERTFKGLCEHHQEREESGMLQSWMPRLKQNGARALSGRSLKSGTAVWSAIWILLSE